MYGSIIFKKKLTAVRPAQRLSFGGRVLGWSICARQFGYGRPSQSERLGKVVDASARRRKWWGRWGFQRGGGQGRCLLRLEWWGGLRLPTWPAVSFILKKWSAHRIFRGTLPKQSQINLETVASYLWEFRSRHVNHHHPLDIFYWPRWAWLIKGRKRLVPR